MSPGLILALQLLLQASSPAPIGAPKPDDVTVSPAWLTRHMREPGLVLIAIASAPEYQRGHVPGARRLEYSSVIASGGDRGLAMELPRPDSLRRVLEGLGVSDSSHLVIYGPTAAPAMVARVFFTLDYAGVGDRVSILDGGLAAWVTSGGTLDTLTPTPIHGTLNAPIRSGVLVDARWVAQHLRDTTVEIVDARDPPFYAGAQLGARASRLGHVPGARNIAYGAFLDSAQRYTAPSRAASTFESAGVHLDRVIVAYCHTGQIASVVYVAARRLGATVKLYDGAFEDWSRHSELPVRSGAVPEQ